MDRGAWWAAVHRITRIGHDLVTKPLHIKGRAKFWSPNVGWCGFRPLIQSLEQSLSNPAHHPSLICEIKRAEFTLCVTVCCTMKRTSFVYRYFPSLVALPPTPLSHPFRPVQSSELSALHSAEGSYCCRERGWGEEFVPVKREKREMGCSEKEKKKGMSFFLSLSWKQRRWIHSEQAWTFLGFFFSL